MIRRLLAVPAALATLAVAALTAPAAATAAPYPPFAPANISASAYDPCAGASNVIGGNDYQPGETVRISLARTGVIGSAVVGADGSWQTTVTIPLSERGSDQVTATGLTSGQSAGTTLAFPCVEGQSAAERPIGAGSLAATGAVVGGALLLGLVLLGGGTTLVVAGRRRRVTTG